MQPILGNIFLLCFVALFIYEAPALGEITANVVVWWLLMIFWAGLIFLGMRLFLQRKKDPKEIQITDKAVSSIYRDGVVTRIEWNEVESVIVKEKWQATVQIMEIVSNDKSKRIVCTSYLPKWGRFKQFVANHIPDKYKGA
jgi:hypothetical protein